MKNKGLLAFLLVITLVFGGFVLVGAIFAAAIQTATGIPPIENQIAIVPIDGAISDPRETLEAIREVADSEFVAGIVVRINSPGGEVAPSQEILAALEAIHGEKPVATSMSSVAASGGYYVALGGERIFASPGTLTGSIGVITQLTNVEGLLKRVGVRMETITAGELKAAGSPFDEMTEEERALFEALVQNIHDQFIGDVVRRRELEESAVREVADGRVLTGQQAHEAGLVDELGGLREAVDWVHEQAELEGDPVLLYHPRIEATFLEALVEDGVTAAVDSLRSRPSRTVEARIP